MRANEFITEQPVTTTNAQGVTTTVNKAANRVTTKDAGGTVVKDRSGNMRSITTPKIGGVQLKQTFRRRYSRLSTSNWYSRRRHA